MNMLGVEVAGLTANVSKKVKRLGTDVKAARLLAQRGIADIASLAGRPNLRHASMVKEIIAAGVKGVAVEIGAGVPLAALIYNYGGASRWIFATKTPYAREARDAFLGKTPEGPSVSAQIALDLATAGKNEAETGGVEKAFGIGVTAATTTLEERQWAGHFNLALIVAGRAPVMFHGTYLHFNRVVQQLAPLEFMFGVVHQYLTGRALDLSALAPAFKAVADLVVIDQVILPNESRVDNVAKNLELLLHGFADVVVFAPRGEISSLPQLAPQMKQLIVADSQREQAGEEGETLQVQWLTLNGRATKVALAEKIMDSSRPIVVTREMSPAHLQSFLAQRTGAGVQLVA